MPHIQTLEPHVADLIAAGEVVERPASVVKELVENAVDAGGHAITIEIQNGGMTLIRVTDDGCGIAPEEAETAFLRHATSKLRTAYDLEAIGTLGFRGEALAAISSVSRVQLLTCQQDAPLGISLELEGGVLTDKEEAGCPAGTTMLVKDLFYNTPARLKYMKKDSAEAAACLSAIQRQALAHPEVSFKYIRDGKQELLTPGDGQLRSALYAVLGRNMALGFTPVQGTGEGMEISGFVSMPACCRGTRGYQFFFVNDRWVKSGTMSAALEQAYANQKMVGKFPGCVLHLKTKLNAVDVNVHPTKQEVRFGAERQVFSTVYHTVLSALEGEKRHPTVEISAPKAHDTVTENQTTLPLHDATHTRRAVPPLTSSWRAPGKAEVPVQPQRNPDFWKTQKTEPSSPPAAETPAAAPSPVTPAAAHTGPSEGPQTAPTLPRVSSVRPVLVEKPAEPEPPRPPIPPAAPVKPAIRPVAVPAAEPERQPEPEEKPWRIAGELFRTYIIVEQGDRALLIDKHAAHERMNFDRMQAETYEPMSQELLTPVVFTPAPEEGEVLLAHLGELEPLGFDVSDFGGGSLAVRRVPDYVSVGDVEATLSEVAGKLLTLGTAEDGQRRDEILHTMACKAAIKGGWKSAPEELERVARAVMSGQVKYCPHGRPVAIELTRAQLEKQFKRT